jgi:hypothetical protein
VKIIKEIIMHHDKFIKAIISTALALSYCIAAPAFSEDNSQTNTQLKKTILKTVESNGKVTYSDETPKNIQTYKQFELKSYGSTSVTSQPKAKEIEKNENIKSKTKDNKNLIDEEKAALELIALKKDTCDKSKQTMASLNMGRVIKFKENGDRYFLSDIEINNERIKTTENLNKNCQ